LPTEARYTVQTMAGSPTSVLFLAVPAAVVGAASFGLASALQQRATKEVPSRGVLNPRLVVELAHRPNWLLATGAVGLGLGLQVVALAFAPLALVQPLLVTGVLFGTLFAAWLAGRRPDLQILIGAAAAVAGLAAFLVLARPQGAAAGLPDLASMLPVALVLVVVVAGCLVVAVASRFSGSAHVAALAVGTGICYGVTAGLMKVVTAEIRMGGVFAIFSHPAFYVVCLIGPAGFLLSQSTFQQGVLIAPALAVITIVDPLVATAIGVTWLRERLDSSPPVLAAEAVAAVVLITGIVILTRRGTQLRQEILEQAERDSPPPTR
jgi:drug/metabolite transporter (DMT)-like permease